MFFLLLRFQTIIIYTHFVVGATLRFLSVYYFSLSYLRRHIALYSLAWYILWADDTALDVTLLKSAGSTENCSFQEIKIADKIANKHKI